MAQVLLAEHAASVRTALAAAVRLAPDIVVAGSVDHTDAVLPWLRRWSATAVVLDLDLPGGEHPLRLARRLAETRPSLAILMLCPYRLEPALRACFKAGTTAIVHPAAIHEILPALSQIRSGGVYLSPCLTDDGSDAGDRWAALSADWRRYALLARRAPASAGNSGRNPVPFLPALSATGWLAAVCMRQP